MANVLEQCRATRLVALLRPDQRPSHVEWRPKQFLDRPDAFGDKQALPFASFPPSEVASQGQDLHSGMCLAFFTAVSFELMECYS